MVGSAGLIHPVGSVELLSEQIGEVLGHQTYRDQLSAVARERAVSVYSVDGMCERYLSLYLDLSSKRHNNGESIPTRGGSTQSPSGAVLRVRPPHPR
jgi:hypothetical protein